MYRALYQGSGISGVVGVCQSLVCTFALAMVESEKFRNHEEWVTDWGHWPGQVSKHQLGSDFGWSWYIFMGIYTPTLQDVLL